VSEEANRLGRRVRAAATARFGRCGPVALRPLEGGHSGLTWAATLDADVTRSVVVKSTPEGRAAVGRHDVLRQARALEALGHQGLRVPQILLADEGVPPFFAMERVEGASGEPVLETGPPPPAEEVARLWTQLVDLLAALHACDVEPLLAIDPDASLTPDDEVRRWQATARAAGLEDDELASRVGDLLAGSVPAPGPVAVLHGDFRLGNTLYQGGRIQALIDWEIWSVGDARCDLGWLLLFTRPDTFPQLGGAVEGAPDAAAVVEAYGRRRGRRLQNVEWFQALAAFKLAAVQAHNLRRHREGRREDDYLERFAPSIPLLLAHAEQLLDA
jgi:aminoglycoside phosphotransferase (APT) family kinase protein